MRAAFVTALLLPYLLLQSIAAGVMPVMGKDGLTFVICTGEDIVAAALSPDGSYRFDPETPPAHGETGECPWAMAQGSEALAPDPDLPSPDGTLRILAASDTLVWILPDQRRHAPPARAPPLHS